MLQTPATTPSLPGTSPFAKSMPAMRETPLSRRHPRGHQHHRRTRSVSTVDPDLIAQLQADRKANIARMDTPRNGDNEKPNTQTLLAPRGRLAQLNEETKLSTDGEQGTILRERRHHRHVSFDLSRNVVLAASTSEHTPSPSPRPPVNPTREPLCIRTLGLPRLNPNGKFNNCNSGDATGRPFIPLTSVADEFEYSETETEEWTEEEEAEEKTPTMITMTVTATTAFAERNSRTI